MSANNYYQGPPPPQGGYYPQQPQPVRPIQPIDHPRRRRGAHPIPCFFSSHTGLRRPRPGLRSARARGRAPAQGGARQENKLLSASPELPAALSTAVLGAVRPRHHNEENALLTWRPVAAARPLQAYGAPPPQGYYPPQGQPMYQQQAPPPPPQKSGPSNCLTACLAALCCCCVCEEGCECCADCCELCL